METPTVTVAPPAPPAQPTPPTGSVSYFKKAQVSMPLFAAGAQIQFEVLDKNYGVIAVRPEQKEILTALELCANNHRGGILRITKDEYESLKKKLPLTVSANKSKQRLQLWDNRGFKRPAQQPKSNASAAAGNNTASTGQARVGSAVVGGGGAPAGSGAPLIPALKRLVRAVTGQSPVLKTPASGQFREVVGPPRV